MEFVRLRDLRIEQAEEIRAPATQLVSLYVPPSRRLTDVINRLQSEHAEAENIKSKSTRQNVQRALSLAINKIQSLGFMPDEGMVVLAGVDEDGDEFCYLFRDFESPIESYRYQCGKEFLLEPLYEALDDRCRFGLIVAERRRGTVGRLVGESIEECRTIESGAKGKHSAGGFSQQRFERLEEEATQNFYEKLVDEADRRFDTEALDGIAVGGSTITVDEFADELPHDMRELLVGTFEVEYAGEEGLRELVETASDAIQSRSEEEARQTMDEFFDRLRTDPQLVSYGREAVERAVEMGAVETLLVGPDERDEELLELVEDRGGDVVVVPDTFEKGNQFAEAFDGIGALLRYDVGTP